MDKIRLEVLQPFRKKVDEGFDHLILPGVDGDFGIMPEHTAAITQLRPGVITGWQGDEKRKWAVHDGFVSVENNHVRIVCEVIEEASEIDIKRAEDAKQRAERRLKVQEKDTDFRRAEAALHRAMTRIRTVDE